MNENAISQTSEFRLTRREAVQGIATLAASSLVTSSAPAQTHSGASEGKGSEQPFSDGWRFHRGDVTGADAASFDDSEWRTLDVPHDWSIEDLQDSTMPNRDSIWAEGTDPVRTGPFDLYASEGQGATGWTVGGVGWYRKTFQRPQVAVSGKVEVRFDGVYMNADVWINGTKLGSHPYGYTGFAFDLTPHLKDGPNTLALRVDNTGRNSRWYSGSGIFRKVWLAVAGPIRIPQHGVYVTMPDVSKAAATINVETTVENATAAAKSATVELRLVDSQGAVVLKELTTARIAAGGRTHVAATLPVKSPHLWSTADPYLYRIEVDVLRDGQTVDSTAVNVGIRKVEADAQQGLRINGEPIKLMGGCVHHDNGPLGSACIPRAEERRVEILKANGYNAIRTSHNPPSREFLDACDCLGMLVIDEAFDCWTVGKNPQDYSVYFKDWWQRDMESMILRDRNHPCVIIWSIGNEIPERAEPNGVEIGKALQAYAHKLDPTRPVTAAICAPWDHPKQTWKDMQAAFTYLDIGGYNYQLSQYVPDHATSPQRVMVGTESFPLGALQNWNAVEANSWVIGDFVWTAIDYLGESGIGHSSVSQGNDTSGFSPFYPWFNSYCGDIDLIGNRKPQSYFRDVVWRRGKIEMAVQRPIPAKYKEHISLWGWSDELRSWTWPGLDGVVLKVRVYTRGDEVRLFLNGKQVGQKQLMEKDALKVEFDVPYGPGELKAVALQNGQEIGTIGFNTVGKPARLVLTPDRAQIRASSDDLSYVMATVVDDQGRTVPDATFAVRFSVSGNGTLAAVGNANPKDVGSFRQPHKSTFHGACLAILRPTGERGSITLKAEAANLEPASIVVKLT